jgi:hypothetical protein
VPGQHYVVQFKEQVDQATWTDLPSAVTATSSTALKVDATAEGQSQRFYRVLRAE